MRDGGDGIVGLMGLMLYMPEVGIFVPLAVMLASKHNQLPFMPFAPGMEEGQAARAAAKYSSDQAEVLSCRLAGPCSLYPAVWVKMKT